MLSRYTIIQVMLVLVWIELNINLFYLRTFSCRDMGIMYEDGTFVINGRVADALRFKVFGDVVYPSPIEEAVSQHPSIKDISVE